MINLSIGTVIGIDGTKIKVLMNTRSNMEVVHYNGEYYPGVTIGSFVGIIRGSHKLIAQVDREYLEDLSHEPTNQEFNRKRFKRILEMSLIGVIEKDCFEIGTKIFPMIYNNVILLKEKEIQGVLLSKKFDENMQIPIGKSVMNDVFIGLSWPDLFNTHIGIFGNTGSGKSNTLAKLYTELIALQNEKIGENFNGKSQFFVIDFNGEYTETDVLGSDDQKYMLKLDTHRDGGDKILLAPSQFWDVEVLSILYEATEKTQKPFIRNSLKYFLDVNGDITTEKVISGLCHAYKNVFEFNNNKDSLEILKECIELIGINTTVGGNKKERMPNYLDLFSFSWNSTTKTFYSKEYLENCFLSDGKMDIEACKIGFREYLSNFSVRLGELTITEKLLIITKCQMIHGLVHGYCSPEFINPLISRIKSRGNLIERVIEIDNKETYWKLINIISLRNCNAQMKKLIPLLITKQLYFNHKNELNGSKEIAKTIHLIIDEAHNILSSESVREAAAWKDYRLELFEEIIKEGRKFGFYITLSSQRPSDISPTIMSQLHNYFIHRLVNNQDLNMISNTVSSLDSVTRSKLPVLGSGQCVITGTSFMMPILVQVDQLDKSRRPSSDNANLEELWSIDD